MLAGGSGERFGGPKALATLGGMTLAARAVSLLSRVVGGGPIVVSLGQETPVPQDLPATVSLVRDVLPDAGPLAGLAASLAGLEGKARIAVVCSCDSPATHPAVISRLAGALDQREAEACLCTSEDGRAAPFPAAWLTSLAGEAALALKGGQRSPSRFIEGRELVELTRDELLADEDVLAGDPDLDSLGDVDDSLSLAKLADQPPRVRVSSAGRLASGRAWSLSQLAADTGADTDAPCRVNGRLIPSAGDTALAHGDFVSFGQ